MPRTGQHPFGASCGVAASAPRDLRGRGGWGGRRPASALRFVSPRVFAAFAAFAAPIARSARLASRGFAASRLCPSIRSKRKRYADSARLGVDRRSGMLRRGQQTKKKKHQPIINLVSLVAAAIACTARAAGIEPDRRARVCGYGLNRLSVCMQKSKKFPSKTTFLSIRILQ